MPTSADAVSPFVQDPPRPVDLFQADGALQAELQRRVPDEQRDAVGAAWARMGELTRGELWGLSRQAELEEPRLVQYGPWGHRVDRIEVSPAWHALHAISAREGLVATGYDRGLGQAARVAQAGLIHLFSASSAIYSCPLAMTDAAARVLLDHDPQVGQAGSDGHRLLGSLLSRDPQRFITSGQWMTERTGGSDVGMTETLARPTVDGDPWYELHGIKWFTSATTSQMALALARIVDADGEALPGSRGLTMFVVEVEQTEHGGLKDIEVRRLKDKLGTKALPTAELSLLGLRARRLGAVGRGVPNISTMLNITRYWNACSSSSAMAQAALWARDYAERRVAFGRPIAEHPLHRRALAEMEADAAGALALCMELASLLGRVEAGVASETEHRLMRALLPIAKATTGKQAVAVTSEGLEAFGGNGYVEDTGLPRMLRDAQVLPIWEGTTNVLSLDVLRAQAKDGALGALLQELGHRAAALSGDLDPAARSTVKGVLGQLGARLQELATDGDRERMEWEARRITLTTGYLWEAVLLGETAAIVQDQAAARRFRDLVGVRLGGPLG